MGKEVSCCLAVSEECLGDGAPVLLQGGLSGAMGCAAKLGFDSVELHIREAKKLDMGAIHTTAKESGLRIAAVGTGLEYSLNGLSLSSPEKAVRDGMAARLKEHIDFAAYFGAVVFIGLCRGKTPSNAERDAYLDRFAEELAPIAAYAEQRGVVLGLEPIAFYLTNLLNTTKEALDFLRRPGLHTVGLLLDTHHMFLEDKSIEEAFRSCAGRIAHVHISDSNRRYPGGGNVDFTRVGAVLREISYNGAVSLEVLPFPTGEQAARRGIEWMHSVWGGR